MSSEFSAMFSSPLGFLHARGSYQALTHLTFLSSTKATQEPDTPLPLEEQPSWFSTLQQELSHYFSGELSTFTVPLALEGTAFQKQVWQKLLEIPLGETRSYQELAMQVGGATYTRAVGLANSLNPIAILVPCHRVIGSDGELRGYAGGVERKQQLLEIEGVELPSLRQLQLSLPL